jgi:hypothetical protein
MADVPFHCNLFHAQVIDRVDTWITYFGGIVLLQNCGTLKAGEYFSFGYIDYGTMLLILHRADGDTEGIEFPLTLVPKT